MATEPKEFGWYQVLILVLSFYVLIVLAAEVLFELPDDVSEILIMIDNGICIIFIADFFARLYRYRWSYLKWGWIDLISSIPMLESFRLGRAVRVIRILKVLRALRSSKNIFAFVFKDRAKSAFSTAAMVSFIALITASITILQFEKVPGSNIQSAEDALWWAFVTMTTVGYGDKFPVTLEGRIIAGALMMVGVGLFGTFTGYIASWFVEEDIDEKDKEDDKDFTEIKERLSNIENEIKTLSERLKTR